jgi:UDP:flavonoid glycosyltransferase YjiC (YdhE family)
VASEGYGHSSRSEIIGRHLLEAGHDVRFAASGKSLSYLGPFFPGRVFEIFGLRLVYQFGMVRVMETLWQNIRRYGI